MSHPKSIGMCFERLRGLIGDDPDPLEAYGFIHNGPPESKAKARIVKDGRTVYSNAPIRLSMEAVAKSFQGALQGKVLSGNVALLAVFYRPNHQRIDADNLLKLILDSGTIAGAWMDDSQVTTQGAIVEYDPVNPRTIITLCQCPSTLLRGDSRQVKCVTCERMFEAPGRPDAKYCSRGCRVTLEPVPCAHCGILFPPRTNGKYCSVKCRGKAMSLNAAQARVKLTHCKHGHLFTEETAYTLSNGHRRCRKCQAVLASNYRKRRLEKRYAEAPGVQVEIEEI